MFSYIGSYAIGWCFGGPKHLNQQDCWREPSDIDILTDEESFNPSSLYTDWSKTKRIEVHYSDDPVFRPIFEEGVFPPPETLLTLKMSHMQWNVNNQWVKHCKDIVKLLEFGIKPNEDLYFPLQKFWANKFGKKKAYLAKTNEEFFQDGVNRIYDHDSLHFSMAYGNRPLYEKIKPDLTKAFCSRKLFNRLSDEDKLKLCREELYVTALERYLIPVNFKRPAIMAYRMALQQLITSMTSGFFCDFMVFNLNKLVEPDVDFIKLFTLGILEGKVKVL